MVAYIVQEVDTGLYFRQTGRDGLIMVKEAPKLYTDKTAARRAISNYKYHKDCTEFVIKKVTLEVENG